LKSFCLCLSLSLLAIIACKKQHKAIPVSASPDYKKGVSFLNSRHDSAYYYLNKAATESKDSLQIAQAYNVMAVIQSREGDYYGAQEDLLTSLKYLHAERENDQYCLVADYNVLGSTSLNQKNYDAAIGYYDQALHLAKNERSKAVALNNEAVAFQKKGQYAQAVAIYESILFQSKKEKKEYARVLCNLATVRWLQDSNYRAGPDLLLALQIRKEEKDDWGLNSNYAHLADYYMHSWPDSALIYAKAMYAVATQLKSPDDEIEALEKLITLSPANKVKPFFAQYWHLKDSLETARNAAKNQFALIRYEVEKNKADNLRLLRENAEKKAEVVQQRAISLGEIAIFMLLTGGGILWYRKRKQKLEWENESAKQNERLQISKKVHDVVANGIYHLMKEVEYGGNMERGELVDQLDDLYIQSRDISYEPTVTSGDDFQVRVAQILSTYGATGRKVLITGNEENVWKDVGPKVKTELEPILRELMVNMDKHSEARNVVVRFDREGKGLIVQYTDDGVGLPADCHFGNGLTNTENRIAGTGGRISFDRNTPTGVKVRIYFPND
jgi:tetratricopeptide (TPR) repeat protein